ncbi:MAG: glycosyltransferase [Kiritimatiellae bacterium]|nr:glycosyltransferase [Kiritimatiellia bacterium]
MNPVFSVIIPTLNRKAEVRQTLERLRENVGVAYEAIVVDNSAAAMDTGGLAANERYYHLGYNYGAAARNFGLHQARAPYVLMLDDDSHPRPGTLRRLVQVFEQQSESVAGLVCRIQTPAGEEQAAALPTVFHGAGAAFRREPLFEVGGYPDYFVFYGEEYWVTLALHQHGYRTACVEEAVVLHRTSETNRDVRKIFLYLARNNAVLWNTFVPEPWREKALYDTFRRYELISLKEGVHDAYREGVTEAQRHPDTWPDGALSEAAFARFALLDAFDAVLRDNAPGRVVLCGCGKFPSLWADHLRSRGVEQVWIADFNPGLVGNAYADYTVLSPAAAFEKVKTGAVPVTGHTSVGETRRWLARPELAGHQTLEIRSYRWEADIASSDEIHASSW